MPTVPALVGPQIENRGLSTPYQNPNADSRAFGSQIAAGLEQGSRRVAGAADTLSKIALDIQDEDNTRQAKQLDVELSSALRSINYGDGTAQNPGYFGTRGEQAISGFQDTQKQIQETHKKLLQSAKNDRVRQIYGDVAAKRIEHELGAMSRFVGQQRVIAADTVSEARMQEAAANASVSWNDPAVLRRSVGVALAEVKSMADRNGWGPEVVAAKEREVKTVIASSAIKAALAVEATGAASSLFKQFQGDMTAEVRNSLQKQIREGNVAGSAVSLAKQADAMFRGDIVKQVEWLRSQRADPRAVNAAFGQITAFHNIIKQGEQEKLRGEAQLRFDRILEVTQDPDERIRLARSLPPELRDAVETRLNHENAAVRQKIHDELAAVQRAVHQVNLEDGARLRREREENEKAYKMADDLVRDSGTLRTLSPELRAVLKPEQIHNLEVREQQLARGEKFAPESNDTKLREYLTMDGEQLANLSQAELRSNLSERDFNRIENMRQETIAGKRDPKNPLSPIARARKKVTEILGKVETETEKKLAAKAELMVDEQIRLEQNQGKKMLSREREDEIINSVFDKIVLSGSLPWGMSDSNDPAFKVKVPEGDRKQIVDAYRIKFGRRPTELEIISLYAAKTNEKKK